MCMCVFFVIVLMNTRFEKSLVHLSYSPPALLSRMLDISGALYKFIIIINKSENIPCSILKC